MSRPPVLPPSLEALLSSPAAGPLEARHGRERLKEELRRVSERLRSGLLSPPEGATRDDVSSLVVSEAARALEARPPAGPLRVLNATGILLHTNLGRAPLAAAAREAVLRAAGYCALEYDLEAGGRGRRGEHVRSLVVAAFAPGLAEVDALAVTNTAAALLLALDTVANGRKVVVSRGELVAIGGDFRVPSIVARSGASLLEAGTTNRTTPEDYREALREGAAAVLKVHPSNYRIVGFTESVGLEDLSVLCREAAVPLVYDAGSGSPVRLPLRGDDDTPGDALRQGADLVCFSADKTLGGPQAGILIGRSDLILRATKNPLARALRPDKLAIAALAATLDLHLSGNGDQIPFRRMLASPLGPLEARARALATQSCAAGLPAEAVPSEAAAGGGSGTDATLPSWAVAISAPGTSADDLARTFRKLPLPVIGRIHEERFLLDVRSVLPEEDDELRAALVEVARRLRSGGP